jgi:prepilin-type N-terminal cleavage/methylation domain-containing protein
MKLSRGFTLIEVMLTIGVLTLLFVALAIIIDPAVELQKIRDTRRASQIDAIYGALENYFAVNGTYPQGVLQLDNSTSIEICASQVTQADCQNDGLLYLSGALEPNFITQIPTDSQATGNSSGFLVHKNTTGQIGLTAPLAEFRDEVSVGAAIDSGVEIGM